MTSLKEFFCQHEADMLKGISHKNSIIKRNIIAYMAINGQCTLAELTKELHISVPTITKLVNELISEDIVCDNGKVETPGAAVQISSASQIRPSISPASTSAATISCTCSPTSRTTLS